ncbi:contactin-5-like [Porites lutea]|uniref:contactin-5-like n=1 Tax=Porites lutea TaxID=51062 RepID=UPI003CC594C7
MMSRIGSLWTIFAVFAKICLSEYNFGCVITPIRTNIINKALNCSFSGLTVEAVNWTRNGRHIKEDFNKTWSAVIVNSSSHDQVIGKFKCTGKRGHNLFSCSAYPSKPTLQPLPSVKIVEKGRITEVVCKASGWPAPRLSWWKNDVEIHHGYYYNSYFIHPSSRGPNVNTLNMGLLIASNHHHGTYTCRAHNLFGTSTQDINIMIKLVTEEIFLPNDMDQFAAVALVGKNTTLECTCKPNKCNEDSAYVYWKFKNHYVNQSARTMVSKRGLDNGPVKIVLTILNLSRADEGQYLCGINTTLGFAEKQSKLHVLKKGSFPSVLPKNVSVKLHTSATLSCTVIYPNVLMTTSPFIYWKVNHTLITKSSKDYKMRDGIPRNHPSLSNTKRKLLKLEIFNVSMQDLGCYYSCGVKFNKDILVEGAKICVLRFPKEEASDDTTEATTNDEGMTGTAIALIASAVFFALAVV